MKEYKVKATKTGNCPCLWCGKYLEGKLLPYTAWWKDETEKRGHNEPMCSRECAESWIASEMLGVQ